MPTATVNKPQSDGKWLALAPTMPLEDAARRVFEVRLGAVARCLPPALKQAREDPEHVHQLRVATRRARAALDIFEPCLPDKVNRKLKKHLRKLRRAAGAARDWDVFLEGLHEQCEPPAGRKRGPGRKNTSSASRNWPGLDLLTGYALGQRAAAQVHLEALAADHYAERFDGIVAATIDAVAPADASVLGRLLDLARPLLFRLVGELATAAAGDLDDYGHLHQVRILGKRLRYAMEICADCFLPQFREQLYIAVEEMQEILGAANDSHVALGALDAVAAQLAPLPAPGRRRVAPGIAAVRQFHARRLPRQVTLFKEWWSRWERDGGAAALARLLRGI